MPEAALRVQKQFWKPLDRAVRRVRRPRTVELWQPPFRRPFRLRAEQRGTGLGGVRNPLGGVRSPFGERRRRSAAQILGTRWADANGYLAVDFTDITSAQPYGSMAIVDGATPANNWETTGSLTPFDKLTWTGASLRMCYGSDGVLRYAPHNLFTYSETLSNGVWIDGGISSGSRSNGALSVSSSEGYAYIQNSTIQSSTFPHTLSFEATCDQTVSNVPIRASGATSVSTLVNFVAGVAQRVSISGYYPPAGSGPEFGIDARNAIVPGGSDSTGYTVTINKVQLQRTPVHDTSYIATTSSAVYKPRIDYDPSTLAVRGLLVEEARTNLCLRSQEIDNAAWTKAEVTATADQIDAPDGTTTAELITETTTNSTHRVICASFTSVTSTVYTLSCYAKNGTRRYFQLALASATFGATAYANFDLQSGVTGTVGGAATATITNVGNGWYRCTITATCTSGSATDSALFSHITSSTSARAETYVGTSTTLYLWGAQLEAGDFATSYIPTTSASATRAADAVSLATSAFPASATQTVYGSIAALPTYVSNPKRVVGFTSPIAPLYVVNATQVGSFDGATAITANVSTVVTNPTKLATADDGSSTGFCANGGTVTTTALALASPTKFYIGSESGTNNWINGHIKQIMYLPRRLTNANLQTLTT